MKVPQAQYCLAILYRDNGHKIHSHAWFNIASTGKHEKAIKERNFIEKSMSSDDVKEAQRMAEAISRDQMTDLILT